MKPTAQLFLAILAFSLLVSVPFQSVIANNDNDKVMIDKEVNPFNQLILSGVFNAKIKTGDQEKVVIETTEKYLKYITIRQEGNKLVVETDDKLKSGNAEKVNLYIVCKDLEILRLSGVGNVKSENALKGDDLELSISGVGKTHLHLEVNSIMGRISAVGDIYLKGKAGKATMTNSGVGNFDLSDFVVKDMHMVNSGVGNVMVHATENLDLSSSGIGKVTYTGNPTTKNISSTGLGKVSKQ